MRQTGLSTEGFEAYRKVTRREAFLNDMNQVVPWQALVALVEPVYPKAGTAARRSASSACCASTFCSIGSTSPTPGVEEALYDSPVMHKFVGIDLGLEPVPDETTILRFRHLLEAHELGEQLFAAVHRHLEACGLKVATGTIVDATIISAPSSTKNRARDPEMRQTKKGNQWHFGMKAHIGVDSKTKLIHSVAATAANVHDAVMLPELLHGGETWVWGDRAYQGQTEVIREEAPRARDFTHRRCRRQGEARWTKRSRRRIAPSPRCGPRWNTPLA